MFKINDQEISDPSVIADKFCIYFSNIGPNLADKIPQSSISHHPCLGVIKTQL